MKKRFFGFLFVMVMSILPTFAEDLTYKGVVQVIGYENVYGKTPRMIGWGSASVIDAQGYLLTNNHVVDNGFGGTLDGFTVCITISKAQRPQCTYTASLVQRDIEKDIAILRLDSTDIFNKPVDLSKFTPIPLAFDYIPNSQDPVVAIGYPRVGADTITETVGVVAGTQAFNGVTYIKTDALIAGGNSGGPLTKDGRVIGVNTFGIGGFFDASLGYALLIKDAQDLITSSKGQPAISGFDQEVFHTYLRTIYEANNIGILDDPLVSINLGGTYRITEYEPNRLVVSYQMLPDGNNVQAFLIERFQTAPLSTQAEFAYYLQKNGLYNPSYEKMKPVTIGGIPMFDVFEKTDPSEGLAMGYKKFVAQLTPTDILFFTVQTPTYDESRYAKAKQKLDEFLANVTFTIPSVASAQEKTIILKEPQVTLQGGETTERPFTRGGRGEGSLRAMRYSAGIVRTILDTLHESIWVNVYPQTRDLGRGTSVDELMRIKTQDLTMTHKGKIIVDGHEGFYYCQSNSVSMVTKQGQRLQGDGCSAFIVIEANNNDNLPYIVEVQLQSEQKNSDKNRDYFFNYLEEAIEIEPTGDGLTQIIKTETQEILFDDLDKQHPDFKNVVAYLVKHKILIKNRASFQGDMPMTRGDVVKVYLKGVMAVNMDEAAEKCGYPVKYSCLFTEQKITIAGKEQPIQKIVDDLDINIDAYATYDKVYLFDIIMKLYLAGVTDVPFTQWDLQKFSDQGQLIYAGARQRVQDREYSFFGKRRINLSEVTPVSSWASPISVTWHPKGGLVYNSDYLQPINFDASPSYTSYTPSVILKTCNNNISCYEKEVNSIISVLTLGEMVNQFLPLIDRAKFMPELEEKKESENYGGGFY